MKNLTNNACPRPVIAPFNNSSSHYIRNWATTNQKPPEKGSRCPNSAVSSTKVPHLGEAIATLIVYNLAVG
jgi:hypothetical protein